MKRFSQFSAEYVLLPIFGKEAGVDINPSLGTTVEVAFLAPDDWDPSGQWVVGSWEYDPTEKIYYARRLTTGLTPGKYRMWGRVSGAGISPETPAVFSETLFEVV